MYFLPCKEWKIVGRCNCLRSPSFFKRWVARVLNPSHIAEFLMFCIFFALAFGNLLRIDFEMCWLVLSCNVKIVQSYLKLKETYPILKALVK